MSKTFVYKVNRESVILKKVIQEPFETRDLEIKEVSIFGSIYLPDRRAKEAFLSKFPLGTSSPHLDVSSVPIDPDKYDNLRAGIVHPGAFKDAEPLDYETHKEERRKSSRSGKGRGDIPTPPQEDDAPEGYRMTKKGASMGTFSQFQEKDWSIKQMLKYGYLEEVEDDIPAPPEDDEEEDNVVSSSRADVPF